MEKGKYHGVLESDQRQYEQENKEKIEESGKEGNGAHACPSIFPVPATSHRCLVRRCCPVLDGVGDKQEGTAETHEDDADEKVFPVISSMGPVHEIVYPLWPLLARTGSDVLRYALLAFRLQVIFQSQQADAPLVFFCLEVLSSRLIDRLVRIFLGEVPYIVVFLQEAREYPVVQPLEVFAG